MKHSALAMLIASSITLAGCTSRGNDVRVGNDTSYSSLSDQREAARTVAVLESAPQGAQVIGPVSAERCHRNFTEGEPTDQVVIQDLKVAAYALGADAITGVALDKKSGLTKNCWHILLGSASALRLSTP